MSDGGMHLSFNGLSSIREFSVVEVKAHLASLRDHEKGHLERVMSAYGIDSNPENQSESQRLYVGLIEDKIERYTAAAEAMEGIATKMNSIHLDISREISGQVLEMARQSDGQATAQLSRKAPTPSKG